MEQHIHQILVGFDLSEGALAAMKVALDLARRAQGQESTIRVITTIPRLLESERPPPSSRVEEAVRAAVERLEPGEINIAYEVGWSYLVKYIMEDAHLNKADLIVVGARGDTTKTQVGTETARLVRRSAWPVLVVDPDAQWPPRRILCPIDFSEASERAFAWGRDFARLTGASLHLLHVLEEPGLAQRLAAVLQTTAPANDAAPVPFDSLVQRHEARDLAITGETVSGRPSDVISDVARRGGFDLICMGSMGRNHWLELMIGGTTERVLKALPCSLFFVKPDAVAIRFRATL